MKIESMAIIALPACQEQFSREAALAAGGDGCIAKPINSRTLSQEVAEAVEKAK